jgi:class 3 adenylate cyclase/TolB-like protein/cytochrome c-type biogenesis protein CcmH/NrfG
MQRRLAAILVLDVVGYSRLMGQDEAATLAALKSHRQEIVDPEIARHGGRLVSTSGDGALVEFPSVVSAVECAVAIQQAMRERNRDLPQDRRIEFRMGINLDEVILDGDDILGDGVNVAARLEAFAEPGTVCISGSVFGHVKNRLDLSFDDLGEQQFKNIGEPVRAFRIRCDETAFPYADFATCESLPLPAKPSIAIMPFTNLGGDPGQDYLADGLRLDIQAALVKASGLFLIAANTAARYRHAEVSAEVAGRQMGVRYVLEGAVRRSGQRIRATMELTDVVARQIVWAEQYDRVLDDGLAVQDEVAAEVLKALDVKLASGERWLLHSTLKSLEVLDFFYRGLSRFYAGTKDDNAAARAMFEQVVRLQPDSAVGPAYLCFTYWVDAFRGWAESKEQSLTQAAGWAKRALEHRGSNGLAHIVLASIHLIERRHDEALADCYKAVALRPNCPTANSYLANVLHYCGRSGEAITKVKEAIRITPVYPPWYMSLLAAAYRESGQLAPSITAARHGIRLNPTDPEPRLILCSDYVLAGQAQQAREAAREIVALDPTFSTGRYLAGLPYQDDRILQRLADHFRAAGLPA